MKVLFILAGTCLSFLLLWALYVELYNSTWPWKLKNRIRNKISDAKRAKNLKKESKKLRKKVKFYQFSWQVLDNLLGEGWENMRNETVSLSYDELQKLRTELLVPCKKKTIDYDSQLVIEMFFSKEGHENFAGNYQAVSLQIFKKYDSYILYMEDVYHTEYCVEADNACYYTSVIYEKKSLPNIEQSAQTFEKEFEELTKSRFVRLFV